MKDKTLIEIDMTSTDQIDARIKELEALKSKFNGAKYKVGQEVWSIAHKYNGKGFFIYPFTIESIRVENRFDDIVITYQSKGIEDDYKRNSIDESMCYASPGVLIQTLKDPLE